MISSVGLEVMNSTNPELNWKSVTKGRRSRKSIARSLNGVAKVGNSTSPKRVGDFSGSDSDKLGEVGFGQSTSGKSESVPIKKRRHLLQSPSPHSWSSLRRLDSTSPQTHSSSPLSEEQEQLPYPSCSSGQRPSNWQLRGTDGSAKVRFDKEFDNVFLCDRTEHEYNDAGDFSGIELLAAAASMDDDTDNANKEDLVAEDSLMPKISDASCSAAQSKLGLKRNESENSLSNMIVHGGNTDCSLVPNNSTAASQDLCESPEDGTMQKVNRQHWDLNTSMDAWDAPYDESIAGNTSTDVNDDMHIEERQNGSGDHAFSNPGGTGDQSSNVKLEENKPTTVSPDRICNEPQSLEEHLQEAPNSSYSNAARISSNEATEKYVDERSSNQILSCDAHMETSDGVINTDAILDSSLFTKLCYSSGMLMSEENTNVTSGTVAIIQDEDCSSNVSECEKTTGDRIWTRTQDLTLLDMPASEVSESAIDVQQKDTKDSQEIAELPGTFVQDGQPILIAESKIQNDGTFASGSTIADCQGHLEPAKLLAEHEDNNYPNETSKRIVMEDSCKSSSAGAQCDDPTTVGRIGSVIDGRNDSDVSQDNHVHIVDGDDLTRFQEGYDSPYEDGELRGSFLYSWEDNELDNECVDYESDGRNGDGSDAADYPGSEIVEGGSEGSHNTQRRNLLGKRFPEGEGSAPVKHSLSRHCVKDDSDNNEIAGKGSNAGSGTTVEQSMEIVIEENDDGMKRRHLSERRDAADVKVPQMNEYASKMARGKLQSRIEGRSSLDPTDGKDVIFMQQCRSRRLSGSYSRPERDISPDKYLGRYRPANHGERDGIHQWTSWGSRRRYTSSYQGAEGRSHTRPRSIVGYSADKIGGLGYHDPRQTANYLSKGMHRPLMRRSPVERDDFFGVRRRLPPTRGVSNYRSRGHYSQRGGRDFGEDFEPLPDDVGASVRMSRYLSRREQSFSPSSGRNSHMPLNRRRSRSRSRSRSPRAWPSHRERIVGARRHSRSPDFRSEARMERMRVPFPKPTFASDYGEGYISPSRGRFSPQRNCRWVDDRTFADNHLKRRRSPVRVFRRPQRFDAVGSSGRLKSDEYFRPMIRPGRFSFTTGRDCKLESNYDERRRDDNGEMMHRGVHSDDGGSARRFRHNAAAVDDFETSNLNNEDGVRVTDPRDVPQTQSDREDKRAFKI